MSDHNNNSDNNNNGKIGKMELISHKGANCLPHELGRQLPLVGWLASVASLSFLQAALAGYLTLAISV